MSEKTSWGDLFAAHLATHRRLVIPQLGALVVKEPDGQIVFSELLRRDDDRLRGLLLARGLSEVEAAGAIDRLVFEVRHAVESGRAYLFEGFGTLFTAENGAIVFKPVAAEESAEMSENPAVEEAVDSVLEKPDAAEPTGEKPVETGKSVDNWLRVSGENAKETSEETPREAPKSETSLREPDPAVKGLQYGRPQKRTHNYTYVGQRTRRRVDGFLVIALIVAALAISAIVYGYVRRPPATPDDESVSLLERWGLVSPRDESVDEPASDPAATPEVIDYGPQPAAPAEKPEQAMPADPAEKPAQPADSETPAAQNPAQRDAW